MHAHQGTEHMQPHDGSTQKLAMEITLGALGFIQLHLYCNFYTMLV